MAREYTLNEFISEAKELEVSASSLFYKEAHTLEDSSIFILSGDSILNKYYNEFKQYENTLKLSDQEQRRYECNPQLLSYDLYGTTELWFLLVDLNCLNSSVQFKLNPVKIYNAGVIRLIKKILNLEIDNIDRNEALITKATK